MNKFAILIFCLLGCLPICGYADLPDSLSKSINRVLNETHEELNIGIVISDPMTGKIIYRKNPYRHFTPGSTLKLLTSYVALEKLGPDYRYQTSIMGNIENLKSNILHDNIYFKFSGDPTLTIEDINFMLQRLKKLGIQRIEGNMIIDDSSVDTDSWPLGISNEDRQFCFAAPVSAIIVNQNCFSATLSTSNNNNHKTILTYDRNSPSFVCINNASMTCLNKPSDPKLEIHEDNSYDLKGHINKPINLRIAIQNQRLYVKKIIEHLLATNHITCKQVSFGKTKKDKLILISHSSPLMSDLIITLLKNSDNVIANAIFKKLANDTSKSWQSGALTIKSVLKSKLNIKPEQLVIYDGAGLSRYNLITPMQLVSLLNAINRDPEKKSIFRAALPISGIDGTLRGRMKPIQGKILAKTGTETSISSLAGFVETKDHHLLTFAVIINEGISSCQKYQDLEDKICTFLVATHFPTKKKSVK